MLYAQAETEVWEMGLFDEQNRLFAIASKQGGYAKALSSSDVTITAKSRGKLVDKIRPNKALVVARIPEILMQGEVVLIEDLTKIRNDDFVKFYTLQRRLRFDLPAQSRPLVLLATLKVAELGSTTNRRTT